MVHEVVHGPRLVSNILYSTECNHYCAQSSESLKHRVMEVLLTVFELGYSKHSKVPNKAFVYFMIAFIGCQFPPGGDVGSRRETILLHPVFDTMQSD